MILVSIIILRLLCSFGQNWMKNFEGISISRMFVTYFSWRGILLVQKLHCLQNLWCQILLDVQIRPSSIYFVRTHSTTDKQRELGRYVRMFVCRYITLSNKKWPTFVFKIFSVERRKHTKLLSVSSPNSRDI